MRAKVITAFGFGVTFVVTLLLLAILFPKPTPFQYSVFRIILSLAAAGVAAMIPGFIDLNLSASTQLAIRSGGALAVFVIVYFFNPAQLAVQPLTMEDEFPDDRDAELQWAQVSVSDRSGGKETNWNVSEFGPISWRDIFWLSAEEGWFCGAVREGGGSEDVGAGRLVHTTDGGKTWKLQTNIVSGQGRFRWGPSGNRIYTWTEAGPMQSIVARRRFLGGLDYRVEGLLATTTGIYFTDNGGEEWRRITPIPTTDWGKPQYGHFSQIAVVENFNEIYAVGWQGIAHGTPDGFWEVQLPTYTHPISGIIAVGGSEGRRVWAVGVSKPFGPGGIYRLTWPANRWEEIPLNGIQLDKEEVFTDILELDEDRVIAVGAKGLLVRGSRTKDGSWIWTKLKSPTQDNLHSVTSVKNRLWAVGDNGAVIASKDGGQQWVLLPRIKNESGAGIQLRRVKVFNDLLWVVGYGAVLRSKIPLT